MEPGEVKEREEEGKEQGRQVEGGRRRVLATPSPQKRSLVGSLRPAGGGDASHRAFA